MKTTLTTCPACTGTLEVKAYGCPSCGTRIEGSFTGCTFCGMSDEDRYFCLVFLQCEGSIKDVERVMGISYPTVKGRLEKVRAFLERRPEGRPARPMPSPAAEPEPARASPPPRPPIPPVPPVPPIPPVTPVPPAPADRLAILEALDRGELDHAAAMAKLRGEKS